MDKNDIRRMMDTLGEKRSGLVTELKTLTLKPVEEKRGLNTEETARHDKLTAEIDGIDQQLVPLKTQLRALEEAERANEDHAEEINRAAGHRKDSDPLGTDEYRAAFGEYLRNGSVEQMRALAGVTATKGEELVPTALWNEIVGLVARHTILAQLCDVQIISTRANFAIQTGRTTAVPRAEGDSYSETDPTFGQKEVRIFNLGALTKISEELIDDSLPDAERIIRDDFVEAFGWALELHGLLGTNGNAAYNNKVPAGLVADIANTGETAGALAYDLDDLILMEDTIPGMSATGGTYLTAREVRTAMRLMKDNEGRPLWQPSLQVGAPPLFNGKPVHTSDALIKPALAGDLVAVFGNFKSARIYLRRDLTIRRLAELYAETGQVGVRGQQRWDFVTRRAGDFRKLTLKAA